MVKCPRVAHTSSVSCTRQQKGVGRGGGTYRLCNVVDDRTVHVTSRKVKVAIIVHPSQLAPERDDRGGELGPHVLQGPHLGVHQELPAHAPLSQAAEGEYVLGSGLSLGSQLAHELLLTPEVGDEEGEEAKYDVRLVPLPQRRHVDGDTGVAEGEPRLYPVHRHHPQDANYVGLIEEQGTSSRAVRVRARRTRHTTRDAHATLVTVGGACGIAGWVLQTSGSNKSAEPSNQ